MWMHHKRDDSALAESIEEILSSPDRAAAVLAAALVEDHLTKVLKMRMHRDEKILREIFRTSGPLGNFGTKIDMAFLMGIVSKRAYKELDTIKRIRNEFAHQLGRVTFDSQRVADLAKNLTMPEWYSISLSYENQTTKELIDVRLIDDKDRDNLSTPRGRYLVSCRLFLAFFTLQKDGELPNPRI
jgi:DNA-binding MltR family transcriptional regulator